MAEIPLPWRTYAAHQSNLSNRTRVDDRSWGLEEGLNYLLQNDNISADVTDVERVISSAARRDRYDRGLLAKHIIIDDEVHEISGQIEARSSLSAVKRQTPSAKFRILLGLAAGVEPTQLAARLKITPGTLRTRATRARQIARDIAA